jgi:hypothetical protein
MKGFVKNESDRPVFVLQRAVNPGFSLTFDEAYVVVGEKSGKKKGSTFVNWLRDTYFQDSFWAFYKDEGEAYFEDESPREVGRIHPAQGAGKTQVRRDDAKEKEQITAQLILESEIVVARQLIDKCKNKAVLRKALSASKQLAKKEAHMRYLIKRLDQVYF